MTTLDRSPGNNQVELGLSSEGEGGETGRSGGPVGARRGEARMSRKKQEGREGATA